MRKNFPVTDDEYLVTDDTLIVSRTDTKGKISYVNGDFIDAAEFTLEELQGKPHNIVRHPDMPPLLFENLWDTLKAGKPWVGAIKNRRKNGGFYWVLATASPIQEGGHVTGFMSIRTKLAEDQRALAEELYAAVRENKAHGYRIDAGIIRKRSVFDRFSFFTRTIKSRLTTTAVFQACSILSVGGLGAAILQNMQGLLVLVAAALGAAASLALSRLTARAFDGPMKHLNEIMLNLVQDNFDNRIKIERDDEIGEALRNLQTVQTLIRFGRAEVSAAQRHADSQRRMAMTEIADSFEAAVSKIVDSVASSAAELEASASILARGAEHATGFSAQVADGAQDATSNVNAAASATEEITSSVREISLQMQNSAHMAKGAVDQANAATERVSKLSSAATRIGDIVDIISGIAGQTNLLALNATIEAARAGESGRGFSVVASEVKSLAEQTAKATDEIGRQVGDIQSATEEAVVAIQEISRSIDQLSSISTTIASAIEEQGAATQDVARSVHHAAQGAQQVSSNIDNIKRSAIETGAASTQVLSSAQTLARGSHGLKLEVSKFLGSVRTA
jgi:methyl-accepting chemotaxis protein/aerotaxis receptor